jgi:hypothetical protein
VGPELITAARSRSKGSTAHGIAGREECGHDRGVTYEAMTDDEIIAALRERVAAGRPTDSPWTRAHNRAEPTDLKAAEKIIGYPLPPLLRRIYLEVANGGVGPFSGIEGVQPHGYMSDGDMLAGYENWHSIELEPDEPPPPPRGVIFLCDYGCAMWTLIDCRHPDGRMWWWEEGERDKLTITLAQWLTAWLSDGSRNILLDPGATIANDSWHRPDDYWTNDTDN